MAPGGFFPGPSFVPPREECLMCGLTARAAFAVDGFAGCSAPVSPSRRSHRLHSGRRQSCPSSLSLALASPHCSSDICLLGSSGAELRAAVT